MKSYLALCCLLGIMLHQSVAVKVVTHGHAKENPLTKVLAILQDLEAKVKADAEDDLRNYKNYQKWCHTGQRDYEYEIQKRATDKTGYLAQISKAEANIHADQQLLATLAQDIMSDNKDLSDMAIIRTQEHLSYAKQYGELVDTIDTLDRAINIIMRNPKADATALLQANMNSKDVWQMVQSLSRIVDAAASSVGDGKTVGNFAQMHLHNSDEDQELGAPDAKVYEAHTGGIVELMEDLREKAHSTASDMKRNEMNAQHSYDMRKQALLSEIENDTNQESATKNQEAEQSMFKSQAEGDLASAEGGLKENAESLETLKNGCHTAAVDYVAAQNSREEELSAIRDAIDTLQTNTQEGETHVYGAGDAATSESFLQILGSDSLSERGSQVVKILHSLAQKDGSEALSQLASRVSAVIRFGSTTGEDPFTKVKGLIEGLISKLQDEATSEASKKEWCESQTKETQGKNEKLSQQVESMSARIDKQKAAAVNVKAEIASIEGALAEVARRSKEMDETRQAEHLEFVKEKADLEKGLGGVRMAVKILRGYYDEQDDGSAAASFLQVSVNPIRPAHVKAQAAGKNILSILEVVESDFGKTLAMVTTQEENAAMDYKKQTEQNKLDTLELNEEVKFKTQQASDLDKRVSESESQRESISTELDAVVEYAKGVRESCDVKPQSYEERVKRREEEIAGLNQALASLRGEAFLQNHRGARGSLRGSA